MNNMEIKVSVKDIPEVIEQLQQAEEKINNLQSKIDKAIEFCDYSFKNPWYVSEKELLGKIIDILKEVENVKNN